MHETRKTPLKEQNTAVIVRSDSTSTVLVLQLSENQTRVWNSKDRQGARVGPGVKFTATKSIELWQALKSVIKVKAISHLNLSVSLMKTWSIDSSNYDLTKCHILNTWSHVLNVSKGQHVSLKRNNLVTVLGALKRVECSGKTCTYF